MGGLGIDRWQPRSGIRSEDDASSPIIITEFVVRRGKIASAANAQWPHHDGGSVQIKALMVDVDGVLVEGRPEDGCHWQSSIEEDLGVSSDALSEHFFVPYWESIVLGRCGLMEPLTYALQQIAPHVSAAQLSAYWFERDSRLSVPLLREISWVRAAGTEVYLATNQEHMRAAYLMDELGLAEHVDGIFYSAQLGAKKPDTQFFTRIQAALGRRGEEFLLIDDSLSNIRAALEVGWQVLHWTARSAPAIVRQLV